MNHITQFAKQWMEMRGWQTAADPSPPFVNSFIAMKNEKQWDVYTFLELYEFSNVDEANQFNNRVKIVTAKNFKKLPCMIIDLSVDLNAAIIRSVVVDDPSLSTSSDGSHVVEFVCTQKMLHVCPKRDILEALEVDSIWALPYHPITT